MMFDLGLYFTLSLSVHVDSGPTRLRHQFRTNWGKTEVFVNHRVAHELARERVWQHQALWTLKLSLIHVAPFGLRLEATNAYRYGDLPRNRQSHVVIWHDMESLKVKFQSSYWLTQSFSKQHQLNYAVNDTDPVRSRLQASWTLLADQRLQAVNNSPELTWQGRKLRLISATLSADEDSPVWLAHVQLAELSDFAAMNIGDALRLALGEEIFALVVDGKSLSRDSMTVMRCEISAVSPLALLDAPFSATLKFFRSDATQAVDAVTELIGPVDWQLPHWLIPAGRLLMEGVTPLQAARTIVSAIGGILESLPDGSVVGRRRHPVSLPAYENANVDHTFFDGDVISARARIAPGRGFNRVTLANEEGAAHVTDDRLEFITHEASSTQGVVRAYLNPVRSVTLAHSGHPDTKITAQGEASRVETEVVEFIEGQARTRYPIAQMTSQHWQHVDLGALSFNGNTLTASTMGYSLLALSYLTTSIHWSVTLMANEEVQFFLIDS